MLLRVSISSTSLGKERPSSFYHLQNYYKSQRFQTNPWLRLVIEWPVVNTRIQVYFHTFSPLPL